MIYCYFGLRSKIDILLSKSTLRGKDNPLFFYLFAVNRRVITLLYDVPFSVIPPSTRLYLYEYKISTYTLYSLNIPRNNIRLLGFAADSFQHIITFPLFLIPFRLSSLSEISPFLPIEQQYNAPSSRYDSTSYKHFLQCINIMYYLRCIKLCICKIHRTFNCHVPQYINTLFYVTVLTWIGIY